MKIYGLQKLTLLDYPGKVACTVFTGGCNFRCPFCHNASLVRIPETARTLDTAAVLAFLKKRQGILDGVCITGGEPLLQYGLETFCAAVKELGYLVKLDTNGSNPARLRALAASGTTDYVAMDIKNSPHNYERTVGVADFNLAPVRESVAFLLEGSIPCEFRTTVVRELHTMSDLAEIGAWLQGAQAYFLQSFVKSDDILCDTPFTAYSPEEMQTALEMVRQTLPCAAIRGE